jgi:hypothetical protein
VLVVTAIMLVLAAAMVMLAVIVVVMSVTIVVLAAAARRWRTAATWVAGGRLIERWHGKSMLALWRGRCRTANGQAL